jgi:putative ABC transport system ATP-binding protein
MTVSQPNAQNPHAPQERPTALTGASGEEAIVTEHVSMTFYNGSQSFEALHDINLRVTRGDIHLLMGPSGSGKTTLLSIVGGILRPTAGRVWLLGHEITTLSSNQLANFRLRNIGFIFQGFNLFPALTAAENVKVALKLKGYSAKAARREAIALLDQVGLAAQRRMLPQNLSGGQKQRVAIARALAGNPCLIMADEPTAALDSENGAAVIHLLRDLAKHQGVTVLMVTHDPRILDAADQVTYLEDGRLRPKP